MKKRSKPRVIGTRLRTPGKAWLCGFKGSPINPKYEAYVRFKYGMGVTLEELLRIRAAHPEE